MIVLFMEYAMTAFAAMILIADAVLPPDTATSFWYSFWTVVGGIIVVILGGVGLAMITGLYKADKKLDKLVLGFEMMSDNIHAMKATLDQHEVKIGKLRENLIRLGATRQGMWPHPDDNSDN